MGVGTETSADVKFEVFKALSDETDGPRRDAEGETRTRPEDERGETGNE